MFAVEAEARTPVGELEELRGHFARATAAVRPGAIAYSASGLFALLFAAATVVEFRAFQGQRLDLGDMTQAVWATAHGHFLRVSSPTGASPSGSECTSARSSRCSHRCGGSGRAR